MIIETDRLVLRPFKEGDAADLYEYLKEPEMHCFECMRIASMEQAIEEVKKPLRMKSGQNLKLLWMSMRNFMMNTAIL